MDRALEAIDHTIEIGRKHVADQENLIEGQRRFITELERAGDQRAAENSYAVLGAMEDLLLELRRNLAAAEQNRAEFLTEYRAGPTTSK